MVININRYIKSHLKWFLLFVFALLLTNVAAILVQFQKGSVLNNALGSDYSLLGKAIIFLIVYIVLEIVFMQIVFRAQNAVENYAERDMKHDFFSSILQMEYSKFQNSAIGNYISKFTVMIPELKSKYFSSFTLLLSFCVKIIVVTIALAILNWKVMILTLFLLSMPMYLPKILEKRLHHLQKQYVEKAERFISSLTNILQGFEVIKNFSLEKRIISKFIDTNHDASSASLKNQNYSSLMRGLMAFISYFSYFAIIAFSAYLVFTKEFNAGQFFVAIGLIDQLSYPLIAIAGSIQNIVAIKGLKAEFLEFISQNRELNNAKVVHFTDQIKLNNISFRYPGMSSWVLSEFSLEIKKGSKYLIQGESGCGKTTLINCLLKYHKVDHGAITIDEEPLDNVANIYDIFSIMRQDVFLFSDTLRNNVTLYDDSIKDTTIFEILNHLGMTKYATHESLEKYVGDGMLQLSGGERRRIGLARVLLSSKDVVILDEPISNLDEDNKKLIQNFIMSIKDKTILIVSHEWNNKSDNNKSGGFDRILVMDTSNKAN
jgi:ATP-binding cassette, subfamily B, bacterial